MENQIQDKKKQLKNIRTPIEVCNRYLELQSSRSSSSAQIFTKMSNKQRKELEREIQSIKDDHKFLNQDIDIVNCINYMEKDYYNSLQYVEHCKSFIYNQVDSVCKLLVMHGFIQSENDDHYTLTEMGEDASNITEIHALIAIESLEKNNNYQELSITELVGFLSIFSGIKVSEEYRSSIPNSKNANIKSIVKSNIELYEKYMELQHQNEVSIGEDYVDSLTFDLIDSMQEWCDLENEQQCKYFIQTNLDSMETVSYTHLTLPTTPYV